MPKKYCYEEYKKIFYESYPTLELLSDYNGDKNYITVRCKIHNYIFNTKPNWLKKGQGCQKCYNDRRGNATRKTTKQFISDCKKIHGNKYDYSKVEYNGNKKKVCIICPIHGEFWQTPNKHLLNQGCPKCNESHLERDVKNILIENNIIFQQQKKFDWLGKQSLDFYLPKYNIAIECQGEQHFKEIKHFGGKEGFKKILKRDKIKKQKCELNNLKLYYVVNDINDINLKNFALKKIYNKLYDLKNLYEKIINNEKNIIF